MAYAALQNMIDRFGQAEIDQVADTGSGSADLTRIAQALADAALAAAAA